MSDARELWKRIESVHAVTYFAAESHDAAKQTGMRGFWMGYFGFRAAPLGAVEPGAVYAAFANFAQPMVERSLPDAWDHARPDDLIEARARSAAAALRRLSPEIVDLAASDAAQSLAELVHVADALGRPLFAANAGLPDRHDPVERLWQLCATLREHRGDGHVVALAASSIDGCEAHRLHAATHGTPHEVLRDNRGFSHGEWADAGHRLEARGLFHGNELTDRGRELVGAIEAHTDELAHGPIARSGIDMTELLNQLSPAALAITESGVLPFPNPMGLPRL